MSKLSQVMGSDRLDPRKLKRSEMERMNIPARYWKASLDGVQAGEHKAVIQRYVQGIHEMVESGYGILLWGANGVGKSAAGAIIAKEARRIGYRVLFVRAADFRDAVFSRADYDNDWTWAERARKVHLLVLDDIGKEGQDPRGSAARVYEDLIRFRVAETLATVITSNLPPNKLADPAVGGYQASFVSLLREAVLPVEFKGADLRRAAANDMAKQLGVKAWVDG